MRDPRYDILFEPIKIGPVTAKNRFYQVPHCTGMGWERPKTLAAMRGVKAEGGWGVVNTEYCSVHETSDDGNYPHARLWNEDHIRANRLMTDAVHEHGALAGVELWLGGNLVVNMDSRVPPLGLRSRPMTNPDLYHPIQSRRIDKEDIRDIKQWQTDAAKRAVEAGFDIVYVYATHGYLISEFLDPAMNPRTDEYGGSLENRLRIVKELIEVTRNAVGDKAAVAVRLTTDLSDAESYDTFGHLEALPDLWDLTVHNYDIEMGASRFVQEAALEDNVARAKAMTSTPIVAVGRFTSPDTMARVIRNGTQDMIGAARPSIADPFLPKKIEEGRLDDIRECIGCNVCYAYDSNGVPIRCTQNPTMGEEHRRGWHPDRVPAISTGLAKDKALVIGAGPAGLEAARALGERGLDVLLTEASRDLGGRVVREAKLPGLAEWGRVADWRMGQIDKMANVEVYRESRMSVEDTLAVGADHILVATGSTWATDGVGRRRNHPIEVADNATVISADKVLSGADLPTGHAVIFDDDSYYMGPTLALKLRQLGHKVTLVTTSGRPGIWGNYTQELYASIAALIDADVEIVTNTSVEKIAPGEVMLSCVFSGKTRPVAADWLLPLTRREPDDALFYDLKSARETGAGDSIKSLVRIGDCEAPALIAAAVYSGYKAAMSIDNI